MAKLRIDILGMGLKLMKNIQSIKIDGTVYNKMDIDPKDSLAIQGFYKFINQNRMGIEWFSYRDFYGSEAFEVYIYKLKIHNTYGPAKITKGSDGKIYKYYYLYGKSITYDEWNIKVRKYKLLRLNGV